MIVTVDNLGEWGVLRDGLPHELPDNAWSAGANVRFREGYAEKAAGHVEAFGTSAIVPYHVAPLTVASSRYWVEAGAQKIYSVDNAGTHTNITRQTAGVDVNYTATGWTSTVLGGILVLNNGYDLPQYWAGTGKADNLTDWPSTLRARSVRAFRQFLVAVNCTKSGTNYPHLVKWSHTADPGTLPDSWDETDPTKDAGEADLADHPSVLVDSLPLADSLILYKEGAFYVAQDSGGQSVFNVRKVSDEAGMLSTNCAAAFPGGHVVLGQGDVYVHSGSTPETILTARARRWLFNTIDSTAYATSFLVANPLANEIWVCVPEVGETVPTIALTWNWKANTLGVRELPDVRHASVGIVDSTLADSWASDAEPWSTDTTAWNQTATSPSSTRLVMASSNLLLADTGVSFAGTPMTAYLERTGMSFGSPERIKLLRGVRPIFEGSDGAEIQIQVGASMEPNTAPTWGDPVTFTVGSSLKADAFACGRYLAVKILSDSLCSWRLKRMQFDVDVKGAY